VSELVIRALAAEISGVEVLRGIDLRVASGEVHAVMGPNGAGKSSLANVLMGRPGFVVTAGSVELDGLDLLARSTFERAVAGLYLAPQEPVEIPGVTLETVLGEALRARGRESELAQLGARVAAEAEAIGMSAELVSRPLNVDASGGERKRLETLQLGVLEPRIAVLDELDSGLDIDALRQIARRVERAAHGRDATAPLGVLAITHYSRLLDELRPDHVHVLVQGRIVASGGPELATRLERDGYAAYLPGGADDDAAPGGLEDLFGRP